MPDIAVQTVLRRKLAPPRSQRTPDQGGLQYLLAKTMPRASDELLGLQIGVMAIESGRKDKAQVVEWLEPFDLIFLMKSGSAQPGICTVSSGLLTSLIEMQMSGHVSTVEPPQRIPTRTDAIVASDIIDRWIASAKDEAEQRDMLERMPFAEHYRAGMILDTRSTDLALDPGEFRTLRVSLDLAGGARTGYLSFALPIPTARRPVQAIDTGEALRGAIMETRASLAIVLARLPKTLKEVASFTVGSVLDVPIESLRAVSLEASDGEVIARGRLGQAGGKKAVCVHTHGRAGAEKKLAEVLSAGFLGASVPSGGALTGRHHESTPSWADDDPSQAAFVAAPAGPAIDLEEYAEPDTLPELPDLPD